MRWSVVWCTEYPGSATRKPGKMVCLWKKTVFESLSPCKWDLLVSWAGRKGFKVNKAKNGRVYLIRCLKKEWIDRKED